MQLLAGKRDTQPSLLRPNLLTMSTILPVAPPRSISQWSQPPLIEWSRPTSPVGYLFLVRSTAEMR